VILRIIEVEVNVDSGVAGIAVAREFLPDGSSTEDIGKVSQELAKRVLKTKKAIIKTHGVDLIGKARQSTRILRKMIGQKATEWRW
jgi:hypothetical protein